MNNPLLSQLDSPILFRGDDVHSYRDPAVYYENGIFHMFFTYVDNSPGGPYMFLGNCRSRDLKTWSPVKLLTPKDKALNYSSPGNIIRFDGKYQLCLQTYCRKNGEKYGNERSRVFRMESDDLENWGEPRIMLVKGGAEETQGRMIDPYLIVDRKDPGLVWCFYKQNGASYSSSRDLENWTFGGSVECGENVCVLPYEDRYLVFHSPENGIGVLESPDLINYTPACDTIYLGQKDWPWGRGRLTAGFVLDMTDEPDWNCYLMFFHGSGPWDENTYFDRYASLGFAWSYDLKEWHWK